MTEATVTIDPNDKHLALGAASWWAEILCRNAAPSLLKDAGYDTPDSVVNGVFGDFLIDKIRAHRLPITAAQVEAFRLHLARKIAEQLKKTSAGRLDGWRAVLRVDYDPDMDLCEAMNFAGISPAYTLPFKTSMWIGDEFIKVGLGYRSPREFILCSKREALRARVEELYSSISPYGDGFYAKSKEERDRLYDRDYGRQTLIRVAINDLEPMFLGDFEYWARAIFGRAAQLT